jgi:transketolase
MPDNEYLDLMCFNTIRTLSMDAVQAANSGPPGTLMALGPWTTATGLYVTLTRSVI